MSKDRRRAYSDNLGETLIRDLLRELSDRLGADLAFVGELVEPERKSVRTTMLLEHGEPVEGFEYDLAGTPCANVIDARFCIHPAKVADLYPDDELLRQMGVEAYAGTSLTDSTGRVIGILVAMSATPITDVESTEEMMKISGVRAAAELERRRYIQALSKSEKRFRLIVQDQSEFIVRWLPDGTRTFVNESYCRFFGLKAEEAVGVSFFPLISEEDREAVWKRVGGLTPEKPISTGEHRVMLPDGSEGWNEWTDRAFFDEDGRVLEFQSVGRDITGRKRVETALRESEEEYRLLVENIPAVVWVADHEGNFMFISPRIREITGFAPEEIYVGGQSIIFDRIHPEDRERVEASFADLLGNQATFDIEYRIQHKDGHWIWAHDRAFALREEGEKTVFSGLFSDISGRKRAEESLEKEKNMVQRYLDIAGVMLVVLDVNGDIALLNSRATDILGCGRDEFIGRSWFDSFIPPEEREKVRGGFNQLLSGQLVPAEYLENSILATSGEKRLIAWHNTILRDEKGEIAGTLSSGEDITERRKAEQQILTEKNFADTALDAQKDTFFLFEPVTGKALRWNRAFREITGYTDEEIAELPAPGSYYSPEDLVRAGFFMERVFKEGTGTIDLDLISKDGRRIPTEYRVSVIEQADGGERQLISVGRDVTDRKRAEEKLMKSQRQLRELATHLQEVREEERSYVAREIHDELGHSLATVKIDLMDLKDELGVGPGRKIESIIEAINAAMTAARRLSTEMRPSILDDFGLSEAVSWLVEDFEKRSRIRCSLSMTPRSIKVDSDRSTAVFRVLQEALTNALRHSGARTMDIALRRGDKTLDLEVRDSGRGIGDERVYGPKAFGIIGMRERARSLGGSLEVEGIEGKGTTVRMSVPWEE